MRPTFRVRRGEAVVEIQARSRDSVVPLNLYACQHLLPTAVPWPGRPEPVVVACRSETDPGNVWLCEVLPVAPRPTQERPA